MGSNGELCLTPNASSITTAVEWRIFVLIILQFHASVLQPRALTTLCYEHTCHLPLRVSDRLYPEPENVSARPVDEVNLLRRLLLYIESHHIFITSDKCRLRWRLQRHRWRPCGACGRRAASG